MAENKCNVCNQTFNSDRELQEHQKNAHGSSERNPKQPAAEENRGDRERKIAS